MNALLIDLIPRHISSAKDENPTGEHVTGERVNDSGLLQAMLSFGTFDKYFYFENGLIPTDPRDLQRYENSGRLEKIDIDSLRRLTAQDNLVLFTNTLLMPKYLPLRNILSEPAVSICGVAHALSSAS